MKIAHDSATSQNINTKFAFKTGDISFLNVKYLHQYLLETSIVRDDWRIFHHELVLRLEVMVGSGAYVMQSILKNDTHRTVKEQGLDFC